MAVLGYTAVEASAVRSFLDPAQNFSSTSFHLCPLPWPLQFAAQCKEKTPQVP